MKRITLLFTIALAISIIVYTVYSIDIVASFHNPSLGHDNTSSFLRTHVNSQFDTEGTSDDITNSSNVAFFNSDKKADEVDIATMLDNLNGIEQYQLLLELFNNKDGFSEISYINYVNNSSVMPDPTWVRYFQGVIDEQYPDSTTPVVIQESWTIEQGGKHVSLVTASNVVKESYMDESYEKTVACDLSTLFNPIIYLYSEIFIDGLPTYSVISSKMLLISTDPLSSENGFSFIKPSDYGETDYGFFIGNCFQNINLDAISCYTNINAYNELIGIYFYFPKLYYADINNDQIIEIGILHTGPSSLYYGFELFALIDGHLDSINVSVN